MIVYIIIGVVILYCLLKWQFSYWSRVGLDTYRTSILENVFIKIYDSYFYFKQKGLVHGGTFIFHKSIYIPVDLEVVKSIVQTDFNHFVNRGFINDPPPLLKDLGNMNDEEWRIWRGRLSPTFTSGKMKMMCHTMIEKASILADIFSEQATINEAIDIKDTMTKYTNDIIISTAFGIECNSFKNPNAEFHKFGKELIGRLKLIFLLSQLPPSLIKLFRIRFIPEKIESFFQKTIEKIIIYRESNNVFRKDFMHLLLQLKNKGKIGDDGDETVLDDEDRSGEHLSLDQIVAFSLGFFGAAFEFSATVITFALLELAQNPEMQDKLRREIKDVLKSHNEQLSYEAVMRMEYLDKLVQETFRKYSPAQMIPRLCNKDYLVPGTNFIIKKGQQIMLPFRAIHHDPEYWPEPEKFDPERFAPENKATRHRLAFLPFGEGPRMCIGARFAWLQTKIGIVAAIKDFKLTLNDKTPKPVEVDYKSGVVNVKGTLWMDIEKTY